jgi:hypothetical protein
MKRALAIAALLTITMPSTAAAIGSFSNSNSWSTLSAEMLHELPSPISSAIRAAQRACGDSEARAQTGFVRYFKADNGEEFVSLHFDRFHCTHSSALCNSVGCLHRVFVTGRRGEAREVWHAQTHELGMDRRSGRAALKIDCGNFCNSMLLWNGSRFSK